MGTWPRVDYGKAGWASKKPYPVREIEMWRRLLSETKSQWSTDANTMIAPALLHTDQCPRERILSSGPKGS